MKKLLASILIVASFQHVSIAFAEESIAVASCAMSSAALEVQNSNLAKTTARVSTTSFVESAQTILDDLTLQLITARIDVPVKSSKTAQNRAAIIAARLFLKNDLAALKKLVVSRPVDITTYPNLTAANVALLTSIYTPIAPSYVVGTKAKSGWKKFATKLALIQKLS